MLRIIRHSLPFTMLLVGLASSPAALSQEHPNLILTKAGVKEIRAELGKTPFFDKAVNDVKTEVDAEIEFGIDTPIPKDFSGGYTHARHKKNFLIMQKAGVLFQILEDEKYANYVRDMLFQYEAMYKDLPLHPQTRSYARGKLFWQCLNDANWLVYTSQAYDAIYDWLSAEDRAQLEDNLFRPFADHISIDSPQFFNRVHNHSTWGNAAVGMIGLVMGDDELVERALYGLDDDGLEAGARDNDGGFIKVEGQEVGFLANINEPFSPQGYYTEGPYYQRYAMYPFLIFAVGLENVKPELKIFEHKDGVLLKAVDTLVNLSDADGEFFPINDGQKGMSYLSREVVPAVDIAYHFGGRSPQLLDIAEKQGQVILSDAGLSVALGIRDGLAEPFEKSSINFSDGPDGDQGGVAVLRAGDEDLTLVFKYAAQGLSHGHYDKLSFSLYEKGDEVIQDYGLSRFVNIGQKGGGNYLPENRSWAKQTIAHNTLTQDGVSHFEGRYEVGSQHHSELYFYDASDENVQVVSATEANAYPGTKMHRTMVMIEDENFEKPFVLDILKVTSDKEHRYDLPFYYLGQVLETNFEYVTPSTLSPMDERSGYQHLYVEGTASELSNNSQFSWIGNRKFYTLTAATESDDELLFARIGANDPDFNLRRDPSMILRRNNAADTVFVSVIEPHGNYSPVTESAVNSNSNIAELKVVHNDSKYVAITIEDVNGRSRMFVLSIEDPSESRRHRLRVGDTRYRWNGPFHYSRNE